VSGGKNANEKRGFSHAIPTSENQTMTIHPTTSPRTNRSLRSEYAPMTRKGVRIGKMNEDEPTLQSRTQQWCGILKTPIAIDDIVFG